MNDQYVGDVGDFTKVALLQALGAARGEDGRALRLAVLWWATRAAGGKSGDGRHLDYIHSTEFMAADGELVLGLRKVLSAGRRIASLEESGLFPAETVFHGAPLDGQRGPLSRSELRARWLAEADAVARQGDVVFLDPDNGLAGPGRSVERANARKYVFEAEVRQLTRPTQSLVLYHHASRVGTHREQAQWLRDRLRALLPSHAAPVVLRAPRYSPRFYVVVPARAHEATVRAAVERRVGGPWARLLEVMSFTQEEA